MPTYPRLRRIFILMKLKVADVRLADAETFGDINLPSFPSEGPYFRNVPIRQESPVRDQMLRHCNALKVVRIHAPFVLTRMVKMVAVRTRAVLAFPDVSVHEPLAPVNSGAPVTAASHRASPVPASGFQVNFDEVFNLELPPMPKHKLLVLALDVSPGRIASASDRCALSASAHAESGRIGRRANYTRALLSAQVAKTRFVPAINRLSTIFTGPIWGRIGEHSDRLLAGFRGAMPRTVPAVPGLSRASIIPDFRAIMGFPGV